MTEITNRHCHLPQLPVIRGANEESYNDRFKTNTENEKCKWKLPKSMTNYANKYFEEYILEDSLKEAILCQNSVPDNFHKVKKLDNFLKDLFNKNVKETNKIPQMF